jgi:hypothetical protein
MANMPELIDVTPAPGAGGTARRVWAEVAQPRRGLSRRRKAVALAIAAAADAAQLALAPVFGEGAGSPFEDALDAGVALALLGVVGFQWRLVAAFAAELVPGMALFPSWTAVVLSMPTEPLPLPEQTPGPR